MLKEGKKDGIGILLYKSNRVYEGNWKDDKKDGKGY